MYIIVTIFDEYVSGPHGDAKAALDALREADSEKPGGFFMIQEVVDPQEELNPYDSPFTGHYGELMDDDYPEFPHGEFPNARELWYDEREEDFWVRGIDQQAYPPD